MNKLINENSNFNAGTILHAARIQLGLTREEAAQRLNTSKSIITRIENNPEDFGLSTLRKYAKALGKQIRFGNKLNYSTQTIIPESLLSVSETLM